MVLMITYDAWGVETWRESISKEDLAKILFTEEVVVWRGIRGDDVYYSTWEAKAFTVHEI